MTELQKRFGNLVSAHRRRLGLTQDVLAGAAAVSVETIKKIERGSTGTSFDVIERLAHALNVDPAELFSSEVKGGVRRRPLIDITSELATMSDAELDWARELIAVARKRTRT